jgi:hypothetical protein
MKALLFIRWLFSVIILCLCIDVFNTNSEQTKIKNLLMTSMLVLL